MFFLSKRKENKTTKPKQAAAIKRLPCASDRTGALTGVTMAPFHPHATTECSLLFQAFSLFIHRCLTWVFRILSRQSLQKPTE